MHSGFARKVFENDLIVCNTEDFILAVEWVREIKPQLHTYWVLTNCFAVGEYDMSQKTQIFLAADFNQSKRLSDD